MNSLLRLINRANWWSNFLLTDWLTKWLTDWTHLSNPLCQGIKFDVSGSLMKREHFALMNKLFLSFLAMYFSLTTWESTFAWTFCKCKSRSNILNCCPCCTIIQPVLLCVSGKKELDQYQYLGRCSPTPPLTQQQSIDNKLRLMSS